MFDTIKRLLGFGPRQPKHLSEDERVALRTSISDYLREDLANARPAEIVRENALDVFSGELPEEELVAVIDALLPDLEAKRTAEMADWPEVTDCDRLDAAFAELKASGLIAEQNFWCCQSCASSDVRATIKQARKSGGTVPRGYVFYHDQDTDCAIQGGGLYLAFGSREGKNAACQAIASHVVDTLKRHGLEPEWSGKLDVRIFLPLDWKRRSPLPKFY